MSIVIIKKKNTQKIPTDKILENSTHSEIAQPEPESYGWLGHVYQLNQVLAKMSARGIPIDKERLDNFETLVQSDLDKLLTDINLIIDERERAKGSSLFNDENGDDGYKSMPKKIREMLANQATTQIVQARRKNKDTGKFELIEEEQKILPRYTTLRKDKYPSFPEEYLSWFTQACESEGYVWKSDSVGRGILSLRRELNPNSLVQLKAYCKWMKYKVPESVKKTSHGKELKESVDDKALEELYRLHKDEIFKLTQDYRENAKLIGTYVPGWQPSEDGRVHAVFTFQPATGQLSSRNPNVQNAPGSGDFRKIIKAPEGRVVVEFDYSGYHALMLGYFAKSPSYMRLSSLGIHDFLAAHVLKMQIAKLKPSDLELDLWQQTISHISDLPTWLSLDDKLLKAKLNWIKKNHNYVRNKIAKPACVAEGELVLTSRGLVPIEQVAIDDRVWDGVEWVKHDGVICQGEREVIYYAGLWATEDHQVYTRQKGKVPFGEAASKGYNIIQTGSGGAAIWAGDGGEREDEKDKGILASKGEVCWMQESEMDLQGQSISRSHRWVPELWANYMSVLRYFRQQMGRYSRSLSQTTSSALEELWRQRGRGEICFAEGVYFVGVEEFAARKLQGGGDRSYQQQWTLRARKSQVVCKETELQQSKLYSACEMERRVSALERLGESLHLFMDKEIGTKIKTNRRRNLGAQQTKRMVKVYDILNAGPRHRFTVSNLLLSNCHGIGFGMGARKLYDMNKGSFKNMREAEQVRDVMRGLFPEVFKFQDAIVEQAHRDKKLVSPFGYVRRFWEAMTYKPGKGLVGGEDAEKVKAYLPANTAFAVKKNAMLRLERSGANEKFSLFNEIHDSLKYMPRIEDVDECIKVVVGEMTRPVDKLGGLVCGVEVKLGPSWGELEEVRL